jgi:type I restriction enzyme R subunit
VKAEHGHGDGLGSEVELTALRMEKSFGGEVALTAAEGEQTTIFSGTGKQQQLELEPMSLIIPQLNERFGTDWAPEDRLFYDAVAEKLANPPDMQQKAAANDEENFGLVFGKEFMQGVVDQLTSPRTSRSSSSTTRACDRPSSSPTSH